MKSGVDTRYAQVGGRFWAGRNKAAASFHSPTPKNVLHKMNGRSTGWHIVLPSFLPAQAVDLQDSRPCPQLRGQLRFVSDSLLNVLGTNSSKYYKILYIVC